MATPKLTTPVHDTTHPGPVLGAPRPGQASVGGGHFEHARRIATATATVWLTTAAGVLLEPLAPGLAPGGQPHPTLHPTLGAGAEILLTNLRVLAAPYLLAAFRWPQKPRTRTLGDLLIAALVLENTLAVGLAFARFGDQLLPYLPQLPLEWAALSCALAAWLTARRHQRPRVLVAYGAATLALAAGATACEVLLTPHAR